MYLQRAFYKYLWTSFSPTTTTKTQAHRRITVRRRSATFMLECDTLNNVKEGKIVNQWTGDASSTSLPCPEMS